MALYARIENDAVAEIFETEGNIKEMFPESFIWVDITDEEPQPEYGWGFAKGKFTQPVIDYTALAEKDRQNRLTVAIDTIDIWQTKLLLGRICDSDKAKLNSWLDYIDELSALDVSGAPEIPWPEIPAT